MGTPLRRATDDATPDNKAPAGAGTLRRELDPLISALARAVARQGPARPQAPETDRAG